MNHVQLYEKSVLIAPKEKWPHFFAYHNEFPTADFVLMSAQDIDSLFSISYDDRAVIFLLKKGYGLEEANDILSSIAHLHKRHEETEKLKKLSDIKNELDQAGLLIHPLYPERTFLGRTIVYSGYPSTKRISKIIENVPNQASFFDQEEKGSLASYYEFADVYEEMHFVFNRIASLLKGGVKPDDIYILNPNGGDLTFIPKLCRMYKIPYLPFSKRRLFDMEIGKSFLSLFAEKDFEEALKEWKSHYADDPNCTPTEVNLRAYRIPEFSKEKQLALYEDLLKRKTERHKTYEGGIHIVSSLEYAPENSHIFYLNFALGSAPRSYRDNGYLSDSEKAILNRMTSTEETAEEEAFVKALLTSGCVEAICYAKRNLEGITFRSPLVDSLGLIPKKVETTEEYSKEFASFLLADMFDKRKQYRIVDPNLSLYQASGVGQAYPWNSYDPSYTLASETRNEEYIKHSFSSVDTYYECPFHYYLDRVLEIGDDEELFVGRIGTVAHRAFENSYKESDFDFEKQWEKAYQEENAKNPFSDKENVLFRRVKEHLKAAYGFIVQNDHDLIVNPTFYLEHKFRFEFAENACLKGSIDKAIVFGEQSQYIALVDYKTSSTRLEEGLLKEGLSLQLPVYAYAAKHDPKLQGHELLGLFISPILQKKAVRPANKNEESFLTGESKLKGVFLDDSVKMASFDPELKGTYVSGLAFTKKDGVWRWPNNVRTAKQLEEDGEIAFAKIKEADEKIRTFDFPIRPVQSIGFKEKKDGCAFCAYRDVCNLKEEWIKYVHNENEEEEDESDGE